MTTKCANPNCSTQFMFLRGGRLFHRESARVANRSGSLVPVRKVEFFWLCEACAPTMTVILKDGNGVTAPRQGAFVQATL